jgi:tetratricopeptide (TPR) repeat protein
VVISNLSFLKTLTLLDDPLSQYVPILIFSQSRNQFEERLLKDLEMVFVLNAKAEPDEIQNIFTPIKVLFEQPSNIEKIRINKMVLGGDIDAAIRQCIALSSDPGRLASMAPLLASLMLKKGKVVEAEKVLVTALQSNRNTLANRLKLASFYLEHCRPDEALKAAQTTAALYPNAIIPKLDLLSAYLLCDRIDEATEILVHLSVYRPLSDQASISLAKIYLATSQHSRLATTGLDEEFLRHIQSQWIAGEDRLRRTA